MPASREVLAHLTRAELQAAVDCFWLAPPDRRAKEGMIDAIAASPDATLPAILEDYPRDRLKELCRALHLDDAGKEKAVIIARLAAAAPPSSAPPAPAARPAPVVATPARPERDR